MDEDVRRALLIGASAVAGGWGGTLVLAKVGASYGRQFGPVGTAAGAAVGALVAVGLCKMLLNDSDNLDLDGEFEVEMDDKAA